MSGNFGMGSPFPAQAGRVNRSGPSTPPPIPGIANPFDVEPGSFMEQALMLSGVPGLLASQQPQQPNVPPPQPWQFGGLLSQSPPPDFSAALRNLNPAVLRNLGLGSDVDLGVSSRFAWR